MNIDLEPDRPSGFKARELAALAMIGGLVLCAAAGVAFFAFQLAIELQRAHHPSAMTIVAGGLMLLLVRGFYFLRGSTRAPGIEIAEADQPWLFEWIRQVVYRTGARMPDRVFLTPDSGIFLQERIGLRGYAHHRTLLLGLTILERLSVGGLRACLAYELNRSDQPAPFRDRLIYRLHNHLARVLRESTHAVLAMPFELYALAFLRLTRPLYARRRSKADRRTAQLVGRKVYLRTLGELLRCAKRFGTFLQREIVPLIAAGGVPRDLYAGLDAFQKRLGQQGDGGGGDSLLDQLVMPTGDPLEHAERVSTVRTQAEGESWDDPAPVKSHLRQLAELRTRVSPYLVEMFRRYGMPRLHRRPQSVAWDEMVSRIIAPQQQARARYARRILGRLVRRELTAQEGLHTYLGFLDDPELRAHLAVRLDPGLARFPPALMPQLIEGILVRFLGTLVGDALVEIRGYRWSKECAGTLQVVDQEGDALDPFSLAKHLMEGELDIGRFRMKLFAHGLFGAK